MAGLIAKLNFRLEKVFIYPVLCYTCAEQRKCWLAGFALARIGHNDQIRVLQIGGSRTMAKKKTSASAPAKGTGKRSGAKPASVREMEKFQTLTAKLAQQTAEANKKLTGAQETRRKELLAEIDAEDKRHTTAVAVEEQAYQQAIVALRAQVDPLETALGITPQINLDDLEVAVAGEGAVVVEGISWGIPKPKDLDMGVDAQGNPYPDVFWDKLLVWPGQSPAVLRQRRRPTGQHARRYPGRAADGSRDHFQQLPGVLLDRQRPVEESRVY